MKLGRIGSVPLALILAGAALVVAQIILPSPLMDSYGLGFPAIAILVGALAALPALLLRVPRLGQSGTLRMATSFILGVLAFVVCFGLAAGIEAAMVVIFSSTEIFSDCFVANCRDYDTASGLTLDSNIATELSIRLMIPPPLGYLATQLARPCVPMQTRLSRTIYLSCGSGVRLQPVSA